jgi:hypothetical protein
MSAMGVCVYVSQITGTMGKVLQTMDLTKIQETMDKFEKVFASSCRTMCGHVFGSLLANGIDLVAPQHQMPRTGRMICIFNAHASQAFDDTDVMASTVAR